MRCQAGGVLAAWIEGPADCAALKFVETRLSEATEVGAVEAAGMSVRTFRRQFREATGVSWREYVIRARMLRAAEELTSTGQSVVKTACRAGYRSVAVFSKAFHGFKGRRPVSTGARSKSKTTRTSAGRGLLQEIGDVFVEELGVG